MARVNSINMTNYDVYIEFFFIGMKNHINPEPLYTEVCKSSVGQPDLLQCKTASVITYEGFVHTNA